MVGPPPGEPLGDLANSLVAPVRNSELESPKSVSLWFLMHRNCEIINVSYFQLWHNLFTVVVN